MRFLSYLYGEAARRRCAWYARHPDARRRLARPVLSVGGLAVGGSGKTPLVSHLARLLLSMGERPAVLSRGYARRAAVDGVVIVRDADAIRADLARAGDEPLMLARALDGAVVVVSPQRYLAGRLAELRLGATVHVLDDGFQHLALERDADLLVVTPDELEDPRVLPSGRLREPVSAAARADAVLVAAATDADAAAVAARLGVPRAFRVRRSLGAPRLVEPPGQVVTLAPGSRVLGIAGIARPARFFEDLKTAGVDVAGTLAFRDHHPFSRRDIEDIVKLAHRLRVDVVLTTEKDLVRLLPHRPIPARVASVPLIVDVEPADAYRAWIGERMARARNQVQGPRTQD